MLDWNHRHVKADLAWKDVPQRRDGTIDWGAKVRVAHLDTGYSESPAFGPWKDGKNAVVLTELGRDFLNPRRKSAKDPLVDVRFMPPGHGTRSGSALSGLADEITGIAPGLPLIPCRVTNSSLVPTEVGRAIGKALDYVVGGGLAPIASISLGHPLLGDGAMGEAVDRAYEAGVIVVAAAGQVIDQVSYPGKHRRTICVAGIRHRGKNKHAIYYKYDRYGRIDVWAPADPIRRANVVAEAPDKRVGDGTTYATLHAVAAAALWLRRNEKEIEKLYMKKPEDRWKRIEAFRRLLNTHGRLLPFKSPGDNTAQGLDIWKLINAPLPDPASLVKEADLAGDDRF